MARISDYHCTQGLISNQGTKTLIRLSFPALLGIVENADPLAVVAVRSWNTPAKGLPNVRCHARGLATDEDHPLLLEQTLHVLAMVFDRLLHIGLRFAGLPRESREQPRDPGRSALALVWSCFSALRCCVTLRSYLTRAAQRVLIELWRQRCWLLFAIFRGRYGRFDRFGRSLGYLYRWRDWLETNRRRHLRFACYGIIHSDS